MGKKGEGFGKERVHRWLEDEGDVNGDQGRVFIAPCHGGSRLRQWHSG
jgi:hypothetical protein